jgi:PKD repeat protein
MRVLDYFGYGVPENYVIANFKAENRFGKAPLEVEFSSISQCTIDDAITSWQWDFDGDGETDGEGENPAYVYDTPGSYDVSLITTTFHGSVDTLIIEDFVGVREGMFVYEPTAGQRNFSGSYIRDILEDKYFFPVDYSTVVPQSFLGYDAIFLSHGYYHWLNSNAPDGMVGPLIAYLESGGKAYVEGGDVFGFDLSETEILPYFGLNIASDGIYQPLTQLEGQPGSLAEGMMFDESNQFVYPFIDYLIPGEGIVAFVEDGEANMAIQYQNNTYRTFCMTYSLAELADNDSTTREELLTAILEFFGFPYTGIAEEVKPGEIAVAISPNPCRGQARISYTLAEPCMVELSIFNLFGEPVVTLVNGNKSAGCHFAQWNAEGLPPGIYLYRLAANGAQAVSGKLIVVN